MRNYKLQMDNNKQQKTKKNKCRKPGQQRFLLSVLIFMGLFLIAGVILIFPMAIEGAETAGTVRVPKNATTQMVHDSIAKYFGDSYASKIMRYLKVRNIDFKKRHGSYYIPEGTSALEAMKIICRWSQTPVKLTINGARSLDALADKVHPKFEFSKADFLKAATDSTFLASYGLTPEQALSFFIEDTYEYYWTDSPEKVLKKMGDNYNRLWSDENKAKADSLGLTPAQVMTIASIVDEETNKNSEKGRIGRLYINRLQKGMKLQSDPTIRFALGDYTIKRVTGQHLTVDSPYNTYMFAGLPPGPIRETSAATVKAILDSEPSEDIYMCAKEDFSGYHNFTSTYQEHIQNALRYQHALDVRGIK